VLKPEHDLLGSVPFGYGSIALLEGREDWLCILPSLRGDKARADAAELSSVDGRRDGSFVQHVVPRQDLADHAGSDDLPGGVITVRDMKHRWVAY
jgi:hypothetical protein